MIKVLVVEDSPTVRAVLERLLNADAEISVVGSAGDGVAALDFLSHNAVDVVTMDVHMPRLNGLEATARIMETRPVPIIIVSASWEPDEVDKTFRALEAGAVAIASKPNWIGPAEDGRAARELVLTVKAMAGVKLVRRWPRANTSGAGTSRAVEAKAVRPAGGVRAVAIGASTGGPLTLQTILSGLPADFPVPILIVQHIAPGFLPGMIQWIGQSTPLATEIAAQGTTLQAGHVYFAPDGRHFGIDANGRGVLSDDSPDNGLRPSVSYLFNSLAMTLGPRAVGVVLTGMGSDGADGLKQMRDMGAITVAQDLESAIISGMPSAAIERGAAGLVLSPEGIIGLLRGIVGRDG